MLYIDDDTVVLKYSMPWQEVASDFYDRVRGGGPIPPPYPSRSPTLPCFPLLWIQLKSTTQGYGSFDYEPGDLREADIVKVDILLNGNPLDELSFVCHRKSATKEGRGLAKKLKEVIRRQQFEVVIQVRLSAYSAPPAHRPAHLRCRGCAQAAVAAKIFAKERIPPFRKDVLNKVRAGRAPSLAGSPARADPNSSLVPFMTRVCASEREDCGRRRRNAEKEAAQEPGGGQEADEARRQGRDSPGSVYGGHEAKRVGGGAGRQGSE